MTDALEKTSVPENNLDSGLRGESQSVHLRFTKETPRPILETGTTRGRPTGTSTKHTFDYRLTRGSYTFGVKIS